MGIIRIREQKITIDDEIIAAGDAAIRAALSVDYSDVEDAKIEIVHHIRGKVCPLPVGCGEWKALSEFSRHKDRADKKCTYCSACTRRMSQAYRDNLREVIAMHVEARTRRRRRMSNYPWQQSAIH